MEIGVYKGRNTHSLGQGLTWFEAAEENAIEPPSQWLFPACVVAVLDDAECWSFSRTPSSTRT
jgi:hypothetical protein